VQLALVSRNFYPADLQILKGLVILIICESAAKLHFNLADFQLVKANLSAFSPSWFSFKLAQNLNGVNKLKSYCTPSL
jgi:hypothetical protein